MQLDAPDYDRRLGAYSELDQAAWGSMRATEALPLMHAALADVRNGDDLAARAAASQALSRLIAAAAAAEPAPETAAEPGDPVATVPGDLVATGPGDPVVAAPGDKEPEQYSELSGARQRCVSVPMMMSFVIVCGSGLSG